MPLPFLLGAAAAIAAVGGVGSGVHGAAKMKEANDTMKAAESRHKRNIERFDETSGFANKAMDALGTLELKILKSFDEFSDTIEKVQNRPVFKEYTKDGVKLPRYDKEELKNVSVGAGVLLGGLGGAAAGTAGGFAAAGATTSAVMALGTASTGTAIASLSGAAATNATLAALGGGALAAGGGGMALGATMLGVSTLGVGLLVGGIIFNATGGKLSDKADEAWSQMIKAEKTINAICEFLNELKSASESYRLTLESVWNNYREMFRTVFSAVNHLHKTNWNDFSGEEKLATENAALLVGLLYKMCQVNLVKKAENENGMNEVNYMAVNESVRNARYVMWDISLKNEGA